MNTSEKLIVSLSLVKWARAAGMQTLPDGTKVIYDEKGGIIGLGEDRATAKMRPFNARMYKGETQDEANAAFRAGDSTAAERQDFTNHFNEQALNAIKDHIPTPQTRQDRINAAKRNGTFNAMQKKYNREARSFGKVMDDDGNISDISSVKPPAPPPASPPPPAPPPVAPPPPNLPTIKSAPTLNQQQPTTNVNNQPDPQAVSIASPETLQQAPSLISTPGPGSIRIPNVFSQQQRTQPVYNKLPTLGSPLAGPSMKNNINGGFNWAEFAPSTNINQFTM